MGHSETNMYLSWILSLLSLFEKDSKPYSSQEINFNNVRKDEEAGRRPYIILVEGNVGSGKSTFLDIMESWPGVEVFQEPVEMWRNINGDNLFQKMIINPTRWATTFQLFSTNTRVQQYKKARQSKRPVVLLERSLFSERFCFVQMLRDNQEISNGEFSLLDRYYKMATSNLTELQVDKVVYIRSHPDVLMERIKRRGRQEEESLSLDLLQQLHQKHEDWLLQHQFPLPAPLQILDGDQDLETFTKTVKNWAREHLTY